MIDFCITGHKQNSLLNEQACQLEFPKIKYSIDYLSSVFLIFVIKLKEISISSCLIDEKIIIMLAKIKENHQKQANFYFDKLPNHSNFSLFYFFDQMGSRITRVIYKQQRKKPIKKERVQDIKVLITCFLGFVNSVFFFLFGYLFRPHSKEPDSTTLLLVIVALFLSLQLKQITKSTLATAIGLFVTIVLGKLLSVDLFLLKAILILTTTALSAVSTFQIGGSSFLQALFLWLAYSCFGLGVRLSFAVSQMKIQGSDGGGVGRQESMLAQVVFSLVGIMSIVLISAGKKILKAKLNDSQKQTAFGKQFLFASLNFALATFSYAFAQHLWHTFLNDFFVLLTAFIVVIIFKNLNKMNFIWILVCILAASSHLVDFLTESEGSISIWIKSGKILMINLAVVDCVQKWIDWSSSGTNRPLLVVLLYFFGFYLSQFSSVGGLLLSEINSGLMQGISLGLYGTLQLLYRYERSSLESYEQVVV